MTIEAAIAQLNAEVESLGAAQEGSTAWWVIRGKAHGASLLRAMLAKGFIEVKEAEAFRKEARNGMQHIQVDVGKLLQAEALADSIVEATP